MIVLLRDPVWQFILGSAAIIITIATFMLQRGSKSISFRIISSTHLVNVENDIKIKPIVMIENKEIIDPVLSVVDVYNSGSLPILLTDYEKPIYLQFEGETEVAAASIISTNPKNIDVDVFTQGKRVYIKPIMLNKKDKIRISILTSRDFEMLDVNGRIIGVQQIKEAKDDILDIAIIMLLFSLLVLVSGIYFLYTDTEINILTGMILGLGLGFLPISLRDFLEKLHMNNKITLSTARYLYFITFLIASLTVLVSIAIITGLDGAN